MSFTLSPPPCLADLLTPTAFDNYATGVANADFRDQLDPLSPADLFFETPTVRSFAKCCLSGLWLLHNFLDESHSISQDLETPEGSYWHAIMHRLEGDFSNAKYWYRRVGQHAVFDVISKRADTDWDPERFVDLCQTDSRRGKLSEPTQQLAVIEWQSLFEHCYQSAIE